LLEQGHQLEAANAPAQALKLYLSAARIDDEYAELEFRIARSLAATGDYKAARDHFVRARDLDTLRFRADSRINEINRSVASSPEVALVDADAILSDASPDGIIGSDLVYEHVHLTPEGNLPPGARHVLADRKDLHLTHLNRRNLRSSPRSIASSFWP
jgi:tetratricopeptide (TPR) repeat protein